MSEIYYKYEFDLSALDKFEENVKEEVDLELKAFAVETVTEMKLLAPKDNGTLYNLISSEFKNHEVTFYSGAGYSAYLEFGTGAFAAEYVPSLPKDLQEYAMKFYVNGQGKVSAHPYMFPAFLKQKEILLKRLKALER